MKNLRKQLNEIDKEMLELFEKRLDIIKGVANIKKLHKIDVLDKVREDQIINNGLRKINNKDYKDYYIEFMELQLKISKDLQNKLIK